MSPDEKTQAMELRRACERIDRQAHELVLLLASARVNAVVRDRAAGLARQTSAAALAAKQLHIGSREEVAP